MTPDLQAAAERLRANVYGLPIFSPLHMLSLQFMEDVCLIRDAYLALFPADDSLPLDEAFMRSVNWASIGSRWYSNTQETDIHEPTVSWHEGRDVLEIAGLHGWKIKNPTRGDFRALLKGLKLPLTESPSAQERT